MNLKNILLIGGLALGMGMAATSCVDDLNLEPNDPNMVDPSNPDFNTNSLAICYAGIATSGINGPGSSYVEGLDAGTSAYLRVTYMLGVMPTDEMIFLWGDTGIPDLVCNTWGAENGIIGGAYARFMGHVAICNQFLANTAGDTDATIQEMRAQARVLRAYSYYNLMDNFKMSSFITEEAAIGEKPRQVDSPELFAWLESELTDIVDNKLIAEKPYYGRVGLDGAEALLARLYLNALDFSGTERYKDCQTRCDNIIARHRGGGFQGSGLAQHYLYLFARDNEAYMPGGSKPAENEILFGIAYDDQMTQSYGGTTYIINSSIGQDCHFMNSMGYGTSAQWSCFKGTKQMAEKFAANADDLRRSLWLTTKYAAENKVDADGNPVLDANGNPEKWAGEDYSDEFHGFTGDWKTCGGNAMVKFTGLTRNAAEDGGFSNEINNTQFASTDMPIIRLADIYLMWAECHVRGGHGDLATAIDYVNLIRSRAGIGAIGAADLTADFLLNERCRELYWEGTRRRDLIRAGRFVGPRQLIWQFKGSNSDRNGTRIDDRYKYFPIPNSVRSAQPDFKQNPGY